MPPHPTDRNARLGFVALALALVLAFAAAPLARAEQPPNFIVIFTDDQGYGDLSSYGSETIRTPNIDRLATEGRKLTSFMVASPVCTPSRAALLTGSYPRRVDLHVHVLFPSSTRGLHSDERTIADHLREAGYATGCFGKWHLGHHPEVLPTAQGFDTYYGIPYSNDMNHPDNQGKPPGGPEGMDQLWLDPESTLTKWNTPLFEDEEIVELPVDQRTITRRCTQKAIDFIAERRDRPFFVYLPYSMPHIPLYVPDEVRDPDPQNAYVNTIEHLDAEVGRLLDALDEMELAENTYVIYASDNGPWLSFKHHGGSAGPLRDGKGTTFEGGMRVPFLIRGPGIPAGTVCDQLSASIDLLPSIAAIVGRPLPDDREIDGFDVSGLWKGTETASPREEFLYYTSHGVVEGLRQGNWKLLVKRPQPPRGKGKGKAAPQAPTDDAEAEPTILLFDLEADLGEQRNLAAEHPEIVDRLRSRMEALDRELAANARPAWEKG